MFNPFIMGASGGGGSSSGYSKAEIDKFLQEKLNISEYNADKEAILDKITELEQKKNCYTFEELGIDQEGKSFKELMQAIESLDLPNGTTVNGMTTSLDLKELSPELTEGLIQFQLIKTDNGTGYMVDVFSKDESPYLWTGYGNSLEDIKWEDTYKQIPLATETTVGGIKLGETLQSTIDGIVNVNPDKIKLIREVKFRETSTSHEPGQPGKTDLYDIFYTDGTSFTYPVYNGKDGKSPELKVEDGVIYIREYGQSEFVPLITLEDLSQVIIDDTLTKTNYAADSKTVGDRLKDFEERLQVVEEYDTIQSIL